MTNLLNIIYFLQSILIRNDVFLSQSLLSSNNMSNRDSFIIDIEEMKN